jgi:hypothetical protein
MFKYILNNYKTNNCVKITEIFKPIKFDLPRQGWQGVTQCLLLTTS